MEVHINAPQKRSLNPNERILLKKINEGKSIVQISQEMAISIDFGMANRYDVPVESVKGLISSIREKGHENEIPQEFTEKYLRKGGYWLQQKPKQEDENMQIDKEVKNKALEMLSCGTPAAEVSKAVNVGYKTVWAWEKELKSKSTTEGQPIGNVSQETAQHLKGIGKKTGLPVSYNYSEGADDDNNIYAYDGSMSPEDFKKRIDTAQKEEPAPSANDTSSNDITHTDIISEPTENVKHSFTTAIIDAAYKCYTDKLDEVATYDNRILKIEESIERLRETQRSLTDAYFYAEAEAERLWADYEAVKGGVM